MRPTFPADQSAGRVWAADTNGTNGYSWGVFTDFHIIPTNQDFYVVGSVNANAIFKVSRLYFQDYVGDLLMTQEDGTLSILEWDPETAGFKVVPTLAYPTVYFLDFELGTFAPVPIPLISPQP